jgi:hypothetical protein
MANQTDKPWDMEVSELLARAAELSADNAVEMDQFVRGAYAAYLLARPEIREAMADRALTEQIDELRRSGRIALA